MFSIAVWILLYSFEEDGWIFVTAATGAAYSAKTKQGFEIWKISFFWSWIVW